MFQALLSLKLTLKQWLTAGAVACIGILIWMLRAEGTELHKTKIDLLNEQYGRAMDKHNAAVAAAKKKLEDALHAYHEHN